MNPVGVAYPAHHRGLFSAIGRRATETGNGLDPFSGIPSESDYFFFSP